MAAKYDNVGELCVCFDEYKRVVDINNKIVHNLLKYLKSTASGFFVKGSRFVGIGSSYENTVTNPKADFDIAMILPAPFNTKSFECVKIEAGLYKLRRKESISGLNNYLNQNKFLLAETLKETVFSELDSALQSVLCDDYSVHCSRLSSSFCVKLKRGKEILKIDIVPQIEAKTTDIPGWITTSTPWIIQDYINKSNVHILLNLSCSPNFQKDDIKHLILQPSLNLLEKEAMLKSNVVRYSVCIAKAVIKHHKWTAKGLRSFHIKRIALLLYDEIELPNGSPWIGYNYIMNKLITMLESGKIDGCFITGQNIMCLDKKGCQDLAKEIRQVYPKIDPDFVQKILELENGVETKNSKPMPTPTPTSTPTTTPTPAVQKISIPSQIVQMNIPSFMENAAFNWFEMLEAKFFLNKITEQLPKFFYAFAALPEEIVIRIPSTIIAERKFSSLKKVVMNLCEVIKTENFSKEISMTTISDKPSLYLQEIKSTAAKLGVADDVVRSKFIEAVPPLIAPVLSSQNELTLSQLGKLADDLMPFLKAVNTQSTLKKEKVDSLEMIGRSVICSDHIYFGPKALTCTTNCQWPNKDHVSITDHSYTSSSAASDSTTVESID